MSEIRFARGIGCIYDGRPASVALKEAQSEIEILKQELETAKNNRVKDRLFGTLVTLLALAAMAVSIWAGMHYNIWYLYLTPLAINMALGFTYDFRFNMKLGTNIGTAFFCIWLLGAFMPAYCNYRKEALLEDTLKKTEGQKRICEQQIAARSQPPIDLQTLSHST